MKEKMDRYLGKHNPGHSIHFPLDMAGCLVVAMAAVWVMRLISARLAPFRIS